MRPPARVHSLVPRHDRCDFIALPGRIDYSWPDGRRLAFTVTTQITWFAFCAGLGPDPAKTGEPQTHRNYAWRDYGNRVGIWHLFDLLDELGLPAGHNTSSLIYRHAPQITDAIRRRGDEVIAHGRTDAESLRGLWPDDEFRLLRDVTDTLTRHEGTAPRGWSSPGAFQNPHTPDFLKELGYTYLLDWPMDDQPVWLRTRAGPILAMPFCAELDDAQHVIHRKGDASTFCDMLTDQFDEMVEQCAAHPLVMNVSLHPYIFGHPFRVRGLRLALSHCLRHPLASRVWWCTPCQIADHCLTLPAGTVPAAQSHSTLETA
ncbi:MAG: polysaccharide deacetylase [Proteobacteria bacterium]|nr:polysaccharide deacetylase [Burkholderiales bacterium]